MTASSSARLSGQMLSNRVIRRHRIRWFLSCVQQEIVVIFQCSTSTYTVPFTDAMAKPPGGALPSIASPPAKRVTAGPGNRDPQKGQSAAKPNMFHREAVFYWALAVGLRWLAEAYALYLQRVLFRHGCGPSCIAQNRWSIRERSSWHGQTPRLSFFRWRYQHDVLYDWQKRQHATSLSLSLCPFNRRY